MNVESEKSRCPLCGGHKTTGNTTHTADLGSGLVVVRNVPAVMCSQCGEAWIDPETARRLERVVEEARQKHHQVQIVGMEQIS